MNVVNIMLNIHASWWSCIKTKVSNIVLLVFNSLVRDETWICKKYIALLIDTKIVLREWGPMHPYLAKGGFHQISWEGIPESKEKHWRIEEMMTDTFFYLIMQNFMEKKI